jgi:hypothetical protein
MAPQSTLKYKSRTRQYIATKRRELQSRMHTCIALKRGYPRSCCRQNAWHVPPYPSTTQGVLMIDEKCLLAVLELLREIHFRCCSHLRRCNCKMTDAYLPKCPSGAQESRGVTITHNGRLWVGKGSRNLIRCAHACSQQNTRCNRDCILHFEHGKL